MKSSRLVPCVQITVLILASPKLALQLYLCAVRVKAIFSSLLSLICSRIKGCGEQPCAGPGVAMSGRSVCSAAYVRVLLGEGA